MSESSDSNQAAAGLPRFCSECGSALLPDSAFCSECGAPVEGGGEMVLETIKDSRVPTSTEPQTSPSPKAFASKPSKKAFAIAGGTALLLLLVSAGYFVYQRFNGDEGYIHDEGFPVTFSEETLSHYSTPAQLVYFHVISEFHRGSGGTLTVGSPQISDLQVDIRLKFDNTWENWRFVETENDGSRATVAVGLADAGAYEFYHLEKRKGKWSITGTLGSEGF
ncbi:MAG: zinc ribbon domain-containing protein [Verrucomicrobiales bacterium]